MFEKFRFGSYRIDDSELANLKSNNNNSKSYAVAVEFLDSKTEKFYLEVSYLLIYSTPLLILSVVDKEKITFAIVPFVQKKAKGCELLEKVFNHLDITSERDYFGLKICQSSECEVSHAFFTLLYNE